MSALPAEVRPTSVIGQFRVGRPDESMCPRGTAWQDYYVEFSGYFGAEGPQVYAAAPELLEALKEANAFILAPAEDIKEGVLSRIRAVIAKAEARDAL